MKSLNSLVLKGLSILTIIAQTLFTLGGISVVFAAIMMFIVSGNDKSEFYRYVLEPGNLTKGSLVLGCINAVIIFICLIITMSSLRKIVNNINQRNFFVQSNLTNIKIMLISIIIFTAANIISMFIFANGTGRSISNIFANSWSQIGVYVIFLAILYTVYLVFKYGVDLQKDSNTVI
ncbi:DUF2975 domain-containing protein [Companilactobacillus nuruki]|uniref:DUF2975 domain-containing protein n=1 Tax=Companilactobacillus nuruki TaxID=1993540 RepID=A0A2N7ATM9_9LACO|nr:DUF2975 domain-containing protein [Companilactobacillus nuruki]PMD69815.1 hypothetical protein CBP76_07830 [Companilactobacillus nuruki]